MYRLGVEAILGLSRKGDALNIAPCIPANWPGYQLTYRFGATIYAISVENPEGVNTGILQVWLDGILLPEGQIPLMDDGRQHTVRIVMGRKVSQSG